jgi:tRNA(Ile)-lysidine synthase
MANSRSTYQISITDCVQRKLLTQIQPDDHLVVALSGGVDSVVLLDLLSKLSKPMKLRLSAVHVEHGISPNTCQWSNFCQELCDKLKVHLSIFRLQVRKQSQESLEAVARQARYQVFESIQADYIVLAQHQDDQVETLLLQLLRGAGAKGLSAMPAARLLGPKASVKLLRPLLDIPRSTILSYAKQHNLVWVTDESNADTSLNRNFLRHQILPLLEQRFPAYRKTITRSSQHLGEASHLLDELAEIDARNVSTANKIRLDSLRNLSFLRAKNLLRYLLTQQMIKLPNTAKLAEILRQLLGARSDTRLQFMLGSLEVRCYRGLVEFLQVNSTRQPIPPISWQGEQCLIIEPLQSMLEFTHQIGKGINLEKLAQQTVTIRSRMGGERFQPDCKRPRRCLKKILQESTLPPWERYTLPLLFCGERLVWAAQIGIDCDFQVKPGNIGLVVTCHQNHTL